MGLGATQLEDIDVVGKSVEECFTRMWVPYIGDMSTRWPEYDMRICGACSSCQALLAVNMETLKAIGAYEPNSDIVVVAGGKNTMPDASVPDEKILLHGNCTRKYLKERPNAMWIKGCPPGESCLYVSVAERRLVDAETDDNIKVLRGHMADDHSVWEKYVFEKADEFYSSLEK